MKIKKINDFIQNYINMSLKFNRNRMNYGALYIQGRPGIGKSDIVSQICEKNNYSLKVVYMSILPLEKLTGLPKINNNKNESSWTQPEIINFNDLTIDNRNKTNIKILLLDDAHLINKQYQSYLFELLIYRQINGYKIDNETIIILAGNKPDDAANFQPILAPVVNRINFIEMQPDIKDWVEYIQDRNIIDSSIIDFLTYNDSFFIGEPLESYPWPSPRSWTYAGQNIKYYKDNNIDLDTDIMKEIMIGYIGSEAYIEYAKFYTLYKRWNLNNTIYDKKYIDNISTEKLDQIDVFSSVMKIYRDITNNYRDDIDNNKILNEQINIYSNVINICLNNSYRVFIPVILKTIILDRKNKISQKIFNRILDKKEIQNIVKDLLD